MTWTLLSDITASVSPVGTATSDIVTYILSFGPVGVVALAFAFRFIVPAKAVDDAAHRAREDLIAERGRLIDEKTRAEEQRDDALRLAQTHLVPLLTTFTATTSALLPLLQELVSRREGNGR